MNKTTIKQISLGIAAGFLVPVFTAMQANAEPVDIKLEDAKGQIIQCECEWTLMGEDGKQKGTWYGSALKQDIKPGRYVLHIDEMGGDKAIASSLEIKKGRSYFDVLELRIYY